MRLANCNLECTWCDTPYTWAFTPEKAAKTRSGIRFDRAENSFAADVQEVIDELNSHWPIDTSPTMVVISGGEPLMQGRQLDALVSELVQRKCQVHIETAGTLLPTRYLDSMVTQFNVSPKLANSGNVLSKRRKPEVLRHFARMDHAWFKFVLSGVGGFREVDEIVAEADIWPDRVMVMPEGVTAEGNLEAAREIVGGALERGYGLSMRSHILLWKDVRGK